MRDLGEMRNLYGDHPKAPPECKGCIACASWCIYNCAVRRKRTRAASEAATKKSKTK